MGKWGEDSFREEGGPGFSEVECEAVLGKEVSEPVLKVLKYQMGGEVLDFTMPSYGPIEVVRDGTRENIPAEIDSRSKSES